MPSTIKNNKQQTFYSDGTSFTGITVTTGATSNQAKQKIMMIKNGGPPKQTV